MATNELLSCQKFLGKRPYRDYDDALAEEEPISLKRQKVEDPNLPPGVNPESTTVKAMQVAVPQDAQPRITAQQVIQILDDFSAKMTHLCDRYQLKPDLTLFSPEID